MFSILIFDMDFCCSLLLRNRWLDSTAETTTLTRSSVCWSATGASLSSVTVQLQLEYVIAPGDELTHTTAPWRTFPLDG